jgi:hypothetical protein
MGRDSNFVCKTCRKSYYLGYGCHGTWLDDLFKTIDDYNFSNSVHKKLSKNINFETCLRDHDGHDYFTYCSDEIMVLEGNLYMDGFGYNDDVMLVERYSDYKKIDLCD